MAQPKKKVRRKGLVKKFSDPEVLTLTQLVLDIRSDEDPHQIKEHHMGQGVFAGDESLLMAERVLHFLESRPVESWLKNYEKDWGTTYTTSTAQYTYALSHMDMIRLDDCYALNITRPGKICEQEIGRLEEVPKIYEYFEKKLAPYFEHEERRINHENAHELRRFQEDFIKGFESDL